MEGVEEKDVLFIGAGPVGLWTAIQLKILRPACRIVIYERHATYIRSHVLRLDKLTSFAAVPRDERLQKLVDSFPKVIRTNDLEGGLLALAQSLGIQIKIGKVETLEQLEQITGGAKVLVGSDGARSTVRKLLFGDKMKTQECLKCIVDLKYEVEGQAKEMGMTPKVYSILKKLDYLVEESVGKVSGKNGVCPVTVRFIVPEKLYDEYLKGATFANPYTLPEDLEKLGPLKSGVFLWLNARQAELEEKRVYGSEKMTAVKLSVYEAEKVAFKDTKGRSVFLVGDAAFGVPFFRALNNGLICSSKLAHCIADRFKDQEGQKVVPESTKTGIASVWSTVFNSTYNFTTNTIHNSHLYTTSGGSPLRAYQQFVDALTLLEIPKARVKSTALGALKVGLNAADTMSVIHVYDQTVFEEWKTKNPGFRTGGERTEIKQEEEEGIGDLGEEYHQIIKED